MTLYNTFRYKMNFIPLAVVEGLETELRAIHPELDIVLRALINAPEGLQACTTYIVSSVLRAQGRQEVREEGFQAGVVQGRTEGVAMGRAAAWAETNEVEVEVGNERVEDVGEGAARERRVRERDEVLAAANKRRRTK